MMTSLRQIHAKHTGRMHAKLSAYVIEKIELKINNNACKLSTYCWARTMDLHCVSVCEVTAKSGLSKTLTSPRNDVI